MLCAFREGGMKMVLNMSFQACEVQSSCGIVRRLEGLWMDVCWPVGYGEKIVKDYCETGCQPGHSHSQVSGQLTMQY